MDELCYCSHMPALKVYRAQQRFNSPQHHATGAATLLNLWVVWALVK